jgi:hypothetical protein
VEHDHGLRHGHTTDDHLHGVNVQNCTAHTHTITNSVKATDDTGYADNHRHIVTSVGNHTHNHIVTQSNISCRIVCGYELMKIKAQRRAKRYTCVY